jgi:hypothetical protein
MQAGLAYDRKAVKGATYGCLKKSDRVVGVAHARKELSSLTSKKAKSFSKRKKRLKSRFFAFCRWLATEIKV